MLTLQTPPPLATEYARKQNRRSKRAVREITARWRLLGPRFDANWAVAGPAIAALVQQAQAEMAIAAAAYVPAVLAATGQSRAVTPVAEVSMDGLAGVTAEGIPVSSALSTVTIRAKQSVRDGNSPAGALLSSSSWLASAVETILADTQRTSESLSSAVRPVGGYVRAVNGTACGRCVILAGRWYRKNQGFERHPGCKCFHIPASEALAGNWQTEPRAYFDSLTTERQIKLMGSKANAQAVLDGADMGQIINAYRRSNALQVAGLSPIQKQIIAGRTIKFTTEGTTRRGAAYRAMRSHGAVRANEDLIAAGERYARTQVARIMPQTIYAHAANRDDALRLLKLYGWIK